MPSRRKPTGKPRGRRKGDITKRTKALRSIADKALFASDTPLEVMLENMRHYHKIANDLHKEIAERLEWLKNEETVEDVAEGINATVKMLGEMNNARMNSQKCAVEAAPYCHPRLAHVKFDGSMKHDLKEIAGTMSAQEAADSWSATLRSDSSVIDLVASEVPTDEDLNAPQRPVRLLEASAASGK